MFGAGAMTNSIPEIRDTELMFVIGSNTTEAHPIIAMEMKRAARAGSKLIVADPRKIWLSEIADLHLQLRPGTDVALLNGMIHVIVKEGLYDQTFVDQHTENFEEVKRAVADTTPEWAEEITGVPADDIRTAARWYATTDKAGVYYTLGITEHTHGTDNVYCLANLVAMTGHLGKRSAGMNPLRGQNNVQGASDAGLIPMFFPDYRSVEASDIRGQMEDFWGRTLDPVKGLTVVEIVDAIHEGSINAMYIMG